MYNILIFDEQGFFYGSTQKLERQIAKILSAEFNVFFAGGPVLDPGLAKDLEQNGVIIEEFTYKYKQNREPYALLGMNPGLMDIINRRQIHCIYTPVYAHYQFPMNVVPASIPFVLISPFGHYITNGNVVKTYVSGKNNAKRIRKRGVKNVEIFFNPFPDFPPEVFKKSPIGSQVIFGRIGRGEDSIFDPIALKAFKKLEENYPDQVRYIVVNPPPAWITMAQGLGIKNMEFRPPITTITDLNKFYKEIDVMAHARKDGETVGMAIAEAMLSGHPILTHKSRYHNDHFDLLAPSYAKWAETDNVEQYYENMKWMVEHKDQIRSMGQLARERALEIFSLEIQTPKIISDFQEACKHYYHNSFFGRIRGYSKLYWENLKAIPFLTGKFLTYFFPATYKKIRRFYYE
jgi:hypothetical protein